jgi:hypothetical protein
VVVRIATGQAPHFPHAMSEARELLEQGRDVLIGEHGVPFTVDGIPGVEFTGLCDQVNFSNEPGIGGFLPGGDGTIAVPVEQFANVGFTPFPGMRLSVYGRSFIATTVNQNGYRWHLVLTQGHPKKSDLPTTVQPMAVRAIK